MKKKFFYFFIVLLIITLTGCSDPSSKIKTYRAELGRISNSTYDTAYNMIYTYGSSINFSKIKTVRDFLYQNTIGDFDNSLTGITQDDIREFLIEKGVSELSADLEIDLIEKNGNDIVFFYYAYSSAEKIWMYFEEE